MNQHSTALARASLDARFAEIGAPARFTPPVRGWIKAVRDALGMSSAQLARRLGVKQPSVIAIEQSEAKGTIQLATLRRVAAAMDCTLVYALVPNRPLETIVHDRARARLRAVEHSMLLEQQGLPARDFETRAAGFAETVDPRSLWDET
jgi:predicted DNA-binding mobile mystery protein A